MTPPSPNTARDRLDTFAMALMVVLCGIWGAQQVVVKLISVGISPAMQAGLRSLGAALLLLAWSTLTGVRLFERDRTLWPGLAAGALFGTEFAFLFWSLEFTAVYRTVIFLYTAPFMVATAAHFFIPGERLVRLQFLGLIVAFAGVVIAFAEGLGLPTNEQLIGDSMALLAGALWAATTLTVKGTRLTRASPSKVLFYQLAVSAPLLLAISLLLGETGVTALTPVIIGGLAFQIVIVAFITYLMWFWLVATYPAGRLSAFTFLTPLSGMAAGHLLLDEPISRLFAIAALLVGIGIWLVNRQPPRKSAQ